MQEHSLPVRLALGTCVTGVLLLVLLPVIVIAIASFNPSMELSFPPKSLSLKWYYDFFADEQMTDGFIWSLVLAVASSAVSIVLGTLAGIALVRFRFPFSSTIGAFLMSPLVFPGLILGIALLLAFQLVGLPIIVRLVMAHTLLGIPFVMRSVISSLENFDVSIEEAACIHGASRVKAFLLVTLPSIQGGIVAGAVFAFVVSFGEVNATLFLVGPGVTTLPIHIFSQIQFGAEQVIVAAASTLQMLLVIVLVLLLEKAGLSVTQQS